MSATNDIAGELCSIIERDGHLASPAYPTTNVATLYAILRNAGLITRPKNPRHFRFHILTQRGWKALVNYYLRRAA